MASSSIKESLETPPTAENLSTILQQLAVRHKKLSERVTQLEKMLEKPQVDDSGASEDDTVAASYPAQQTQSLQGLTGQLCDPSSNVTVNLNVSISKDSKSIASLVTGSSEAAQQTPQLLYSHATIGCVPLTDLLPLSHDTRARLQNRLDDFAHKIVLYASAEDWATIPTGLKTIFSCFSIQYQDSGNKGANEGPMDLHKITAVCKNAAVESGLQVIAKNRRYWSNRHQDCLLVTEALETLMRVREWLGKNSNMQV